MERALVIGTVPKKAEHHLAAFQPLCRQSRADRNGNAARNNTVCAEIALLDIRYVHRAAPTFAVARLFAKELGEHPRDLSAFGHRVPVPAMGRGDLVFGGQWHTATDRATLLADGEVHCAVD